MKVRNRSQGFAFLVHCSFCMAPSLGSLFLSGSGHFLPLITSCIAHFHWGQLNHQGNQALFLSFLPATTSCQWIISFGLFSTNKWIENMQIPKQIFSEKAMVTHSSILAWKIPWDEEPGRLQSMGSLRVGHYWATSLSLFTFMHWRRKWQPTPVFLPGESQGWRSLVGWRLWGRTESDTTEAT